MNNSEQQPRSNREPQVIKKSLIDSFKDFFKVIASDKEQTVETYLEKKPEKIEASKPIDSTQKLNQQQQKTRLEDLKQALKTTEASSQGNFNQLLVQNAKEVAAEISHKNNIMGFQIQFYKKMASLNVSDQDALPYARYIAQSLDMVSSSDNLTSAKQKVELALEVFVGETGQVSSSIPVLKKIIKVIAATHSDSQVQDYFNKEEFKQLCQTYGITNEQTKEILNIGDLSSENETGTNNFEALGSSIPEHREKILKLFTDPSQAVMADTYLLSLTPLQYMQLIRAKVQAERNGDREALNKFNNQMLSLIPGFDQATKAKIKDSLMAYYNSMADNLYISYERIAPNPKNYYAYMSQQTNVLQNIAEMDDKSLAAYTEFAPVLTAYSGMQMFVEYYRGKIAELFREKINHEKHGLSEQQYLQQLLSSGKELTISSDLFEELFKETRKLSLLSLIQNEYSNYYSQYGALTTKYKTDPYVKAQLSLGNNLKVAFEYQNIREDSFLGEERIRQIETVRQTSLAYIVPLYLKVDIGSINEGFNGLKSVVEAAQKGDPASFKDAAGKMSNETMETLMAMPEVRTTYQLYMSIVKRRLAASGNVLTPDIFKVDRSGKNMLDYQLEQDLKNMFPRMTDEERTIMSTLGKGLTIASGDFLWTISRATPPIRSTLNKLENSSGQIGMIIKKIREGKVAPTMSEFALVKEALKETLSPSFHDFPFRELLFSLNPQKWASFWVVIDDYNLSNLAFAPIKLGERMTPVSERWQMGYEVWRSLIYGIPEGKKGNQIAEAINKHLIPALALDDLGGYMSVSRRGGWRNEAFFYSPQDLVSLPGNPHQYNLEASFKKILIERGPTAAWQFANSGLYKASFDDAKGDQAKRLKETALKQILENLYENSPSFFLSHEQSQFFRKGESFVENIQQLILNKLISRDQAILAFLSPKELESIKTEVNIYGIGGENLVRSRRIFDRLLSTVEFVEQSLISEGLVHKGHSYSDFINNPQSQEFLLVKEKVLKYLDGHLKAYYGLPVESESLFNTFVEFNKQVFFSQNSLFKRHQVIGLTNNSQDLLSYYQYLIKNKKLDPFGWEYLYDKDLFFQEIGAKLINRNIGDLGTYIELTKEFGELNKAIIAAMQKKNQREGFEEVKKKMMAIIPKFKEFKPTYGDEATYKAAATMIGYLASVFRCPPIKDLPLVGKIIPFSESYATFSFPDDKWKQASWGTALMKELIDTLDKEGILPYGKGNYKVVGMSNTPQLLVGDKVKDFKLPEKILGITVPEKLRGMPASILAKVLPAKFFPGLYRNYQDIGVGPYTMDNIRKWANVDERYVNNNMIATILVIGFLMMLIAAIKEGMKESEIK